MRTIKELLVLTRDKLDAVGLSSGLCLLIIGMVNENNITEDEFELLIHYIEIHRPGKRSKYYSKKMRYLAWYWPMRAVKPRREWLNYRIKKHK